MAKEFFVNKDGGESAAVNPEGLRRFHKETFKMPGVAKMLAGLTEGNVYGITEQLLKDSKAKMIIKAEIVKRILNLEPITHHDTQACENNDTKNSTISDIVGNSRGAFNPQDIVSRDNKIFFETRNIMNRSVHSTTIPKNILVDILKTAFLNIPSELDMRVPVSEKQKEALDKIIASIPPENE